MQVAVNATLAQDKESVNKLSQVDSEDTDRQREWLQSRKANPIFASTPLRNASVSLKTNRATFRLVQSQTRLFPPPRENRWPSLL